MLPTLIKAGPFFGFLHTQEVIEGNPLWQYAGIDEPPVRKTIYKLKPCKVRKTDDVSVRLHEGRTTIEFTSLGDLDDLLTDLLAKRFYSRSKEPRAKAAQAVADKQVFELRGGRQVMLP